MRLTGIEFNGYKRLARTSCNVDGKLIAFLGPNESGKTSVLEGLAWLMGRERTAKPLGIGDQNRQAAAWDPAVVGATFRLSEHDRTFLANRYITPPRSFVVSRSFDGVVQVRLENQGVVKSAFVQGIDRGLADLQQHITTNRPQYDHLRPHFLEAVLFCRLGLKNGWNDEHRNAAIEIIDVSNGPEFIRGVPTDRARAELTSLRGALQLIVDHGPFWAVEGALLSRCPELLMFGQADRALRTSYDLSADDSAPAALENLLRLAGTSVEQLRRLIAEDSITVLHTTLRQINKQLRDRLRPHWRQADLTVELIVQGTTVQLLVNELGDDGVTTSLDERSEGLRAFIALMAFLHDRAETCRPVLLIDEAESKLHLDAQADLVQILQQQQVAQQVLYTTHSLDCLPPDVGTGLRFVVPTSRHTSELRSNFWSSGQAGFRELHVLAGASRAAFSRFSRAVLTEGPSEMILLPTLIRLATGEQEIFYRVAPGLANVPADSPDLLDIAARTAYLLDGDKGGATKKAQLIDAGIPASHVLELPEGKAVEDLLTTGSHLAAVNEHLAECGHTSTITAADLPEGSTRSKAVTDWCKANGVKPPGKTVIASRLVNNPDQLELEPAAVDYLKELHATLTEILKP